MIRSRQSFARRNGDDGWLSVEQGGDREEGSWGKEEEESRCKSIFASLRFTEVSQKEGRQMEVSIETIEVYEANEEETGSRQGQEDNECKSPSIRRAFAALL
jgi:hypothetical protein